MPRDLPVGVGMLIEQDAANREGARTKHRLDNGTHSRVCDKTAQRRTTTQYVANSPVPGRLKNYVERLCLAKDRVDLLVGETFPDDREPEFEHSV